MFLRYDCSSFKKVRDPQVTKPFLQRTTFEIPRTAASSDENSKACKNLRFA